MIDYILSYYHSRHKRKGDVEMTSKRYYNINMNTNIYYSGIMTTYACSAACAHCLYCSSPRAKSGFMTADMADDIARTMSDMGVHSMHVGGGEPFMHMESLTNTVNAMRENGMEVDYIETNGFWYRDDESAEKIIRSLNAPIMVSVDPFHAEFVAPEKPLALAALMEKMHWPHFIWQEKFIRRLSPLCRGRKLTRDELTAGLGENYLYETARQYGVSVNGRALNIARSLYPAMPAESFLDDEPCNLTRGMHCHIDLFGNYIPPFCPGLAVDIHDLGNISPEKYPVFTRLDNGGVRALWDYAAQLGYAPDTNGYITKCDLCVKIRSWLMKNHPTPDIGPECFYKMMDDNIL